MADQKPSKSFFSTLFGAKKIITITALFSTLPVWGPYISNALTWQFSLRDRRDAILKSYLSEMSSMMVDQKRSTFEGENDEYAQSVARALSLNTLKAFQSPLTLPVGWLRNFPWWNNADFDEITLFESLFEDVRSKEEVIRFLYESKLLGHCIPKNSDHPGSVILDPNLIEVIPSEVNLSGANLKRINFRKIGPQLCGIDLSNTTLESASLEKIDAKKGRFSGADLRGANLRSTTLNQANLDRADLRGVQVDGDTQVVGMSMAGALICDTDFRSLNQNSLRAASLTSEKEQELLKNQEGLVTGDFSSGKADDRIEELRTSTLNLFMEEESVQTNTTAVSAGGSAPTRRTNVEISDQTRLPALLTDTQKQLIRDGAKSSAGGDVSMPGVPEQEPCFAKSRPG